MSAGLDAPDASYDPRFVTSSQPVPARPGGEPHPQR
jgi:hypothetical protein